MRSIIRKFDTMILKLLIVSVLFVGVAIAGIAIKILLQKNGQFSKTCSTIDNEGGEKVGCVCGEGDPENCRYYEQHHGILKDS